MKTPPTTRSTIRQTNFIFALSAILPSHPEERTHFRVALHCADVARLRGSRYSFGCCSRQRRVSRATTSPEIAEEARSSGLRSTAQHQGHDPVQIPHLVAHLPRSHFRPKCAPAPP